MIAIAIYQLFIIGSLKRHRSVVQYHKHTLCQLAHVNAPATNRYSSFPSSHTHTASLHHSGHRPSFLSSSPVSPFLSVFITSFGTLVTVKQKRTISYRRRKSHNASRNHQFASRAMWKSDRDGVLETTMS